MPCTPIYSPKTSPYSKKESPYSKMDSPYSKLCAESVGVHLLIDNMNILLIDSNNRLLI